MAEIYDAELESLKEQREAWYAVIEVLNEFKPGFLSEEGSGEQCAVRAIRELGKRD